MLQQSLQCHRPFDLLLQASLDQQIDDIRMNENNNSVEFSENMNHVMCALEKLSDNLQDHKKRLVCHNRECNNPRGYNSKPNSIYCSSRCQSRG